MLTFRLCDKNQSRTLVKQHDQEEKYKRTLNDIVAIALLRIVLTYAMPQKLS